MLLLVPAGEVFAQVWHAERENTARNVRSGSTSPVSLSYHPVAAWKAAVAAWNFEKGDFHRPDRPAGKSELDLSVQEVGTLGRVRTQGLLQYRNTREFERSWNSLIGNDPDNPYTLGDTVADDATTERFDLEGALSWNIGSRWIAAGKIGLTTARLTDTRDPRPSNDFSRIPFTLGLEYRQDDGWSAGLYGGAELFFSQFAYSLEDGQTAYRYYKMKGMGDYFAFSSSESASAPREYSGVAWRAGINMALTRSRLENFTELGFETGSENARDGGAAYEWKAGDYRYTRLTFLERLDIKGTLRQSVVLQAGLKLLEGFWYDQKQRTDTEHGNLSYYEIMSRYKNNAGSRLTVEACYRVSRAQSWGAAAGAAFNAERHTHYTDGDPRTQAWNLLECKADVWKTFPAGSHTLDLWAGVGYRLPLGEAVYATGNAASAKDDISEAYVAPVFAYETSARLHAFLRADWVFAPVGRLRPGVFVNGNILKAGTAWYGASAGAFLRF